MLGSLPYVGWGVLAAIILFFRWKYRYWANRNIRTTRPIFPVGDIAPVFFKHMGTVFKDIYDQFKGERYNGMWVLHRPFLMIRDPELIRVIFIRDFNHFRERGLYSDPNLDPLTANLFFMGGPKWRNLRTKLTPCFTSTKMRKMFEVMMKKAEKLRSVLSWPAEAEAEIGPKEYTVGYTHEVVISCLLGLEVDAIGRPKSVMHRLGTTLVGPSWAALIRAALSFLLPDVATLLRHVPAPKNVSTFFTQAVREVIQHRETHKIDSGDFLQTLLQLQKQGYLEEADHNGNEKLKPTDSCKFSFNDAVAQAFIVWVGNFESSAVTMQHALYELALNQEIQDKAREHIRSVLKKYDNVFTYEGVLEMEYLTRIVEETLRKYPPVPILNRVCTESYRIPGTDFVIDEGIPLLVPVLGLHMDPAYYPDPERFDPERFTEEGKRKRPNYTFLPFGEGPHACLGQRFALMQMKLGLAVLLTAYKFEPTTATPKKPRFEPTMIIYTVRNGIPIKVSRL